MGPPKNVGQRLLPVVVDDLAHNDPEHILYTIPKSDRLEDGLETVSARRFANAVNKTAHWLEDKIGRSDCFRTVAYVGPHDLRYILLTLACVKTGHKILLLSPRNSIEGQLGLMKATDCTTLALPRVRSASLAKFMEVGSFDVLEIPEQDTLLLETATHEYPYFKTFEEAENDPLYIVHTSGSTGIPKPLICTNGHQSVWDHITAHTPPARYDGIQVRHRYKQNSQIFNTAPLFHQLGFVFGMTFAIWNHSTSVLGPPNLPPNLASVEYILDHLAITGMILPPPLVDEVARSDSLLKKVKKLDFIATGGGPVSEEGGVKVASRTNLRNIIGASETSSLQSWETPDSKDWKYFRWHPSMGVDMREVAPGLYEQWVVRKPGHSRTQAIFHLYPDLNEFNLRDLYCRHPDPNKADYWCYSGRSDDIIVLGNGEKIQPIEMEAIINNNPEVTGSLVIGSGKFQAAALIELKSVPATEEDQERLMESLRQSVERANLVAPSHAQIHPNFIMTTDPQSPLVRADKGSIKRLATIEKFKSNIARFYEERKSDIGDVHMSTDYSTLESTREGVRDLIFKVSGISNLQDDQNLFSAGLDSLMVLRILKAIQSSIRNAGMSPTIDLKPFIVYRNPSIFLLSAALFEVLGPDQDTEKFERQNTSQAQLSDSETFKALLEKYTENLPEIKVASGSPGQNLGACVILTGTTGSLGSYLLHALASSPKVDRVICINRKPDAESTQLKNSSAKGLNTNWPAGKVEFLQGDVASPQLGLSHEMYDGLVQNATMIIHNAWVVNFNWSLSSFEPQVAGVRNLVDLSAKSKHSAHILFISSVSAVMYSKHHQSIPEDIVDDFTAADGTGYGASKLVSELILAKAAETSGVKSTICRIGQIAGPVLQGLTGSWNKQEWLPAIIAASRQLKLIPRSLGAMNRLDWIPVDLLSVIISELLGFPGNEAIPESRTMDSLKVYNLVNPQTVAWQGLVPAVADHFNNLFRLASWSDWVDALQEKGQMDAAAVTQMPAVKLMDFFLSMKQDGEKEIIYDTSSAVSGSDTLKTLQPVGPGWMQLWLQQWSF